MIDFCNFIIGESGIEVESIDEAKSLIEVCDKKSINHYGISAKDYEDEPYWYVKDRSLCITAYVCDMLDEICDAWTYSQFAAEHYVED